MFEKPNPGGEGKQVQANTGQTNILNRQRRATEKFCELGDIYTLGDSNGLSLCDADGFGLVRLSWVAAYQQKQHAQRN